MLVQICCSVDCDYFFHRLREEYPNEKIIGYFYDPNIHPYSEFLLRFEDSKRISKKYNIEVIKGDYDYEAWFDGAKNLENEPEKGKRCSFCFDFRFENTAKIAKKLGEKLITTTLLMSPKKDFSQLVESMEKTCQKYDLEFIAPDYRKAGGTAKQMNLSRLDKLYHQNYCGCFYALNDQKNENEAFDLMSPLNKQIMPNSPEWKIKFFRKIAKLKEKDSKFTLIQKKIQNYRLLKASVKFQKNVVPSYFLSNSTLNHERANFTIKENEAKDGIYFSKRDGLILINIENFNKFTNSNFKGVRELMFNTPSFKSEKKLRKSLLGINSLNAIIVLDSLEIGRYDIELKSKIYEDKIQKIFFHA